MQQNEHPYVERLNNPQTHSYTKILVSVLIQLLFSWLIPLFILVYVITSTTAFHTQGKDRALMQASRTLYISRQGSFGKPNSLGKFSLLPLGFEKQHRL